MNIPEFELYGWNTPNGQKIIIALEEAHASYSYIPVDISAGEQHTKDFRALSPDGKIPALIYNGASRITLFESGAILLFLANRFPQLNGVTETERAQVMSWTFWQVGQLGPLAGQFGRFKGASSLNHNAIEHFESLVWRCLKVMNTRLENSDYLAGINFTIADMACYPWIASQQSYLQIYGLDWRSQCPAIVRWVEDIASRPSVNKSLQPA